MLKNLLIPLDGSRLAENALPFAIALSRQMHARSALPDDCCYRRYQYSLSGNNR